MLIFDELKKDLDARNAKGFETYGKPMETHDGRDTLQDAYEEALDMCVYLKKIHFRA
jgi:hypothetical protein